MTSTTTTRHPAGDGDTTGEVPVARPKSQAGGIDRLATATAKLRSRTSVPVDRWFQLAGGVLLGIGVLAIIAGWYGVSHTAREWRQTPYVVSGGLLGLGLIVVGAVGYLAYWMTKLIELGNRQTALLERIERSLSGDEATEEAAVVVAGDVAHRPECPLLTGRDDVEPLGEDTRGLTACSVCEPEVPAPAPRRRSRLTARS